MFDYNLPLITSFVAWNSNCKVNIFCFRVWKINSVWLCITTYHIVEYGRQEQEELDIS